MSAFKFKFQHLLLPTIATLIIAAFALISNSSNEGAPAPTMEAQLPEVKREAVVPQMEATASLADPKAHGVDCPDCAASAVNPVPAVAPVLSTKASFDPVFKTIAAHEGALTRSHFDFLVGSQIGQQASFVIGGREFSGSVKLAREGVTSSAYAIKFPEGDMTVTLGEQGQFEALMMFNGDSRIVKIAPSKSKRPTAVRVVNGQVEVIPELEASEVEVSDVFCAPSGATYPLSAPQPSSSATIVAPNNPDPGDVAVVAMDPLKLDYNTSASHVLYLDFDGEEVEGDFWNVYSKIDKIVADPAVYVNNDAWVENVWKRVVEDFAPFNLRITTDRAVYDSALETERLHVIITPTDDVYPGTGGVSFGGSYQANNTRIVWVYNQEEYFCASTISHEVGHAFGLSHDGPGASPAYEYYGGHNSGYAYGWAPIMGAFYNDGGALFIDEVNQWSQGEYYGAYNMEDDLSIIAANGFGFVSDDYGDTYDAGNVGLLGLTAQNEIGGSGLISSSGDVDVFRFAAIEGDATFTVLPLDVDSQDTALGSSTQGANLAVGLRLLDSTGAEVAVGSVTGDTELGATITETLNADVYYLEITGTGRGTDASDGFSDYASLGQYTIEGNLPTPLLAVFGSQPQLDPKTGEALPGPVHVPVISGDTQTDAFNGTDYGYSYPGNTDPLQVHTFRLENLGDADITDIDINISGSDFVLVSGLINGTLPIGASDTIQIAYKPLDNGVNGIDNETVTISYNAGTQTDFQFAVSGLATKSADNDNYWQNDRYDRAHDLTAQKDVWLSDYQGVGFFRSSKMDFFKFTTPNHQLVRIDVDYDGFDGPVTFELYVKIGEGYYLKGSTSATDGSILFLLDDTNYGKNVTFVIKASINPVVANDNYYPYDLRWSSVSTDGNGDDLYESNNTMEDAFDLDGALSTTLSEYLGTGIQNDDDWYKITVPRDVFTRMLHVRADFVNADGDINIEMFDESGEQYFADNYSAFFGSGISAPHDDPQYLAVSDSPSNDYEVISWHDDVSTGAFASTWSPSTTTTIAGVEPGVYYIRVYGANAGNEYDLSVNMLRDDAYEIFDEDAGLENDEYNTATDLGETIVGQWLSKINGIGMLAEYPAGATEDNFIMTMDSDWYRISPALGSSIQQMVISYQSTSGLVAAFRIYDQNFVEVGASFEPIGGNVTVYYAVGDIILDNPDSEYYYIEVFPFPAFSELTGYDFTVNLFSDGSSGPGGGGIPEDSYSPNHDFTEPYNLQRNAGQWLSSIDGPALQLKADWYSINVPEGASTLQVRCALDSSLGNMELVLSRDGEVPVYGNPITGVGPQYDNSGDLLEITWVNPEPGMFTVTVIGDDNGNEYDLFWDIVAEDDNYEENNELSQAFDLTGHAKQLLSKLDGLGKQLDEDWYQIEVTAPADYLKVDAFFSHAAGDVDIELFHENGFSYGRSISTSDDESILLMNPIMGVYYVKVFYGNAGNDYDLVWGAYAQAELDALILDVYESNNSRTEATPIDAHTVWGVSEALTQTDEDWFEITVDANSAGVWIECNFLHSEGDLDMQLISLGNGGVEIPIATSASSDDNELIDYDGSLPGGTYYIRVYGPNLGTQYELSWYDKIQDAYEPNNSLLDATTLEDLELVRLATDTPLFLGDDDYYLLPVDEANSIIVAELTNTLDQGQMNLQLLDPSGNVLLSDETVSDVKFFQFPVALAGNYYLRIYGDTTYLPYDLMWNASPQDGFEDNNDFGDAYDVSGDEGVVLEAVMFEDDFYRFDSPAGSVEVDVTITFDNEAGNLELTVYDEAYNILASSITTNNTESVTFEVNPLVATYYIEVIASGRYYGTPYTLNWSTQPVVDVYEDNNVVRVAYDLSGSENTWLENIAGYATQWDDDWYQVVVSDTATSLTIDAEFIHSAGDIDMELYQLIPADPLDVTNPAWDQRVLTFHASSTSLTDNEQIVADVTGMPGIYFIRVFGGESGYSGSGYRLRWDDAVDDVAGDQVYLDEDWVFLDGGVGAPALLILPQANADGDAFPNWAEFALDLNADLQDTAVVDRSTVEVDGKEYFSISFLRAVEARKRGYQFFVQESATLSFDDDHLAEYHSSEYIGDGIEKVTYRCSVDMTQKSSCFFKVRVDPPASGY